MPYIKQEDRERIDFDNGGSVANTSGELNYLFTMLALEYMEHKGLKYQTINDIVGALEGAKLEFYRRIAAPYEDTKIKENGDVY
jgi:hypothetical protein